MDILSGFASSAKIYHYLQTKSQSKQVGFACTVHCHGEINGKARTCPADPKAAAMDEKRTAEPSGVWQSVSADKEAALGPHTALQPLRDCCRMAASARTPPACTMPPTQGLQWRVLARASPAIMPHQTHAHLKHLFKPMLTICLHALVCVTMPAEQDAKW